MRLTKTLGESRSGGKKRQKGEKGLNDVVEAPAGLKGALLKFWTAKGEDSKRRGETSEKKRVKLGKKGNYEGGSFEDKPSINCPI